MQFRVLGPPEVVRDGRVVPVGGPKQRALLALFLLRPNRFVATDWLIDALWDGRPPASAEMTLRTYVAGLRRTVEPQRSHREPARILRSHPKGYELRVDADAIDAVRFGSLVDRAASTLAAGDPTSAERGYVEALALWRGEPLAGAADLDAVRPEATRLAELRLSAEEGRFTAAVAAGRPASVLAELRQFVAANPVREAARAQLMLALYRSGRQTEALAAFDEGRRILTGEYGLDPGTEIRELHRLILDQAVPPAGVSGSTSVWPEHPPGPTVASAGTSAHALVGRGVELARLVAELAAAAHGGGRVTAVVGEPGIGKTSLAAELSALARTRGVPVVWGRCPDVGQAPPFWLWSQVVRALAAMPQAGTTGSARRLDGFAAGPLHGLAGDAEPDPAARFHAYEAVAELVRTVAGPAGLLIVLDDLHAADPDSLLLLRFLSSTLADARALVVATLRPYEHDTALLATVAELARGHGFSQLRLTGLSAAAVADLVRQRTGAAPERQIVARLVTRTSGNPFFITELLRSRTDPADADLPPSIRDTVRLRLDDLPEPARDCLDLLSVAGHELDASTMATALEVAAGKVADALTAAYRAELVAEAGPGAVRFSHPLFAEVAYAELPPPRRAALHARLATVYERAGDVAPAEVAHHYGHAVGLGHGEDHLRWSLAAADDATRRFAYEDALGHLERAALRLAPLAAGSPSAAQTELSVALHRAALLQMTVGVGADAVDQVCARARDLLALVGPEADVRPALWALGELAANQADFAVCTELAGRLVRTDDNGTGLFGAAGEYLLGVVDYFTGSLPAADRRLTAAVDRLRAVDPRLLGRQVGRLPVLAAYNFRALVRSLRGDPDAARRDIADAEQLAEELNDPYGRANAALYAAWMGMQERDVTAVRAAAQRCRDVGAANGLPHFVTTGGFFLEWAAARGGEHDRLPAMRAAADGIYRPGLRATRTVTLSAMAEAYLAAGDPVTAAALAEEGLAVTDRLGESVFAAELHRIRGIAHHDPAALATGARLAADQGNNLLLARFPADTPAEQPRRVSGRPGPRRDQA
ncbi:transcriptional regulator [Micromonospora craterilacus]|uniref:Transcriptional regulator n=1 Tax=Micromonospora craterilacus TaxID=1655439 RepID=A0A2W2F557_9ACTN|nr:BTAD domain-containing putative transcriptional regulator [Micromonospora craterilacus]PZG16717.1 transcriptional regulator [Micromonospora craterilacus]